MTDQTDEELDWLERELHGLAASSMPFLSSTADAITQLRRERDEAKRLAEYLRAERDALRIEAKIAPAEAQRDAAVKALRQLREPIYGRPQVNEIIDRALSEATK